MNANTQPQGIKAYIAIARIDHWFKNIFMLPGIVAAILFAPPQYDASLLITIVMGVFSTCLAASANYSINEYLDRDFDRKHPKKHSRPAAQGLIKIHWLLLQYLILCTASIGLGYLINIEFVAWTVFLLVMGIAYNVNPLRTKDRVYLDILSESLNNPIRFMLGWYLVTTNTIAPSSILIAYWMGGAFLMTIKRMAEYRSINDSAVAGAYRKSFQFYTADKLLICSFFFAICSSFFLAIFLIKYRIEYLVCFPLLAILFAWYLNIGLKTDSTTQTPEKLYRERPFVVYCLLLGIIFVLATLIDFPALNALTEPLHY